MRHRGILQLCKIALLSLAGRLVPLKHGGGDFGLKARCDLDVSAAHCHRAQTAVNLGQLRVEVLA
eukprot:14561563-Alexandrium_andersonii.AAC.1